jgi:hypothetical protein
MTEADARLAHLTAMAEALVKVAYDHEHGFYHSARCTSCGGLGHTSKPFGGGPVKRGDVYHKAGCPVGIAHDVLEAPADAAQVSGGPRHE